MAERKPLPRKHDLSQGRGVFYKGAAISVEHAALIYDHLSQDDAKKLTDEELSDLALASQEMAEDREF